MNLLPKRLEDFREKEYWDKFFVQRQRTPFEWYGNYLQLSSLLHKCVRTTDGVLVFGCGNSRLSADLYDVGFRTITNVDISKVVITQMKKQHSRRRPSMKWLCADITRKLPFQDGEFDVVLDKGTLDGLMTGKDEDTVVKQIDSMFSEVERLLTTDGRYVCISLLQGHILNKILDWFLERSWKLCVYRYMDGNEDTKESSDAMRFPVFMVECTKLGAPPSDEKSVLECSFYDDTIQRMKRTELANSIRSFQQFAFLQHELRKRSTIKADEMVFDLCIGIADRPRYHLFVVDRPRQRVNKFAIFIVPQGRETEWLFGSSAGRQQLAECASFERLVVVHLSRDHAFTSLDSAKAELSTKVMDLAQKGLSKKSLVPFLSVGDSIGKRSLRHKGTSEATGEFVIEDVEGEDGQMFRRLVFLSSPNVVQSESRLVAGETVAGGDGDGLAVSHDYLSCKHHVAMVAGLAFLAGTEKPSELEARILLVGLGGGGLATFLHRQFAKTSVDVVELDQLVVDLAEKWFGFVADEQLSVTVADGLLHAKQLPENAYDVMMLDVDSKDLTAGMSCPPEEFVEHRALTKFHGILKDRGVFVLNLVCRNPELRVRVIDTMKNVFGQCHSLNIADEVNEIVYARKGSEILALSTLEQRLRGFRQDLVQCSQELEDLISVDDMVGNLNLL